MKFDLKRLSRVYESVYGPGDPNEINKTPGEKLKNLKGMVAENPKAYPELEKALQQEGDSESILGLLRIY